MLITYSLKGQRRPSPYSDGRRHAGDQLGCDLGPRVRVRSYEDIHDPGELAGRELGEQLGRVLQAGQPQQLGRQTFRLGWGQISMQGIL